jgi:hypothetical protein
MAMTMKVPKVQIRLTSAAETIHASLEPYVKWIEEIMGVPLSETLTLELDCNPGDVVAEELLSGLAMVAATTERNNAWRTFIEVWKLPLGVSPRIAMSLQRERKPNAAPLPVWELDWQDCPVAFKLRGLKHNVVSVKVPVVFPPGDMPILSRSAAQHWFIVRREDAAKVLLLEQEVVGRTERYLETAHGLARLQGRYDWNSLVLDATIKRMVQRDFELFFQREDWFRQHNLPYRRGYLFWGAPGNGKSATLGYLFPYLFKSLRKPRMQGRKNATAGRKNRNQPSREHVRSGTTLLRLHHPSYKKGRKGFLAISARTIKSNS